jgi:hypothetical protein
LKAGRTQIWKKIQKIIKKIGRSNKNRKKEFTKMKLLNRWGVKAGNKNTKQNSFLRSSPEEIYPL